ncbi:MAG: hypothetical protein M3R17_18470 [Bacteroidota bacterium]|nr:hypothetical protein [Bacteroidota bacterium]
MDSAPNLKEIFFALAGSYTDNVALAERNWTEIESHYSGSKRHYHTLAHLANLLSCLNEIRNKIEDWDTTLFTLYYHDIIYNALKSDNEEQSAEVAVSAMKSFNVPDEKTERCKKHIIATKKHLVSSDNDTNYFTDADLAALGQGWDDYSAYYKNVRKEYSIYPDLIYNPGRKKVLRHFLEMERIYKTDYFYEQFELQAKENMRKELEIL